MVTQDATSKQEDAVVGQPSTGKADEPSNGTITLTHSELQNWANIHAHKVEGERHSTLDKKIRELESQVKLGQLAGLEAARLEEQISDLEDKLAEIPEGAHPDAASINKQLKQLRADKRAFEIEKRAFSMERLSYDEKLKIANDLAAVEKRREIAREVGINPDFFAKLDISDEAKMRVVANQLKEELSQASKPPSETVKPDSHKGNVSPAEVSVDERLKRMYPTMY